MSTWSVIANLPDRVGESPVWSVAEQAVYWVDIEGRAIRRCVPGQSVQSWETAERVGCIALAGQGRVLAAMEASIALLGLQANGRVQADILAHITHPAPGMRFNDGRCDASGRLWVGTMVMDMALAAPQGRLYCLDERGLTGPHVSGLITPNGLAFSPDGKTLYLSDSHPSVQKIWAFDFDVESGQLANRRLFVDMQTLPGRPDGAAVDSEGHYWICANDAGQIHRFAANGRLAQSLSVPMPKPSMCAFGGPQLQTLFVTSIVPAMPTLEPAAEPATARLSGALIAAPQMVTGLPEPAFSRFPQAAMSG